MPARGASGAGGGGPDREEHSGPEAGGGSVGSWAPGRAPSIPGCGGTWAARPRSRDRTTEIGRLISSYLENKSNLEDHTVHLLFSANRWERVPLIKEKLNQGITLVVDRYAFSGVAFTSAKENFSLDWCKQPDVGLPKPDLILFLQLSTSEAAKRENFGNERYENSSFQEKVLQHYHHLMKDKTLNWKTIDASKSIEELHNEIKSFTEEAMKEVQDKPIGELWK
ncbi:thymidylate kinase isoform X2 [Emydura macquarii macquarii]|uniref:thymidylate kinase isoform X2 n=1 Tax=Emydura macquarii macquarii TaxID=1129001 RepID=UPI00352B330A